MRYVLEKLEDGTEIVYEDIISDGKIMVYAERRVEDGFINAEYYLQVYRWENNKGFSQEELDRFEEIIRTAEKEIIRKVNYAEITDPSEIEGIKKKMLLEVEKLSDETIETTQKVEQMKNNPDAMIGHANHNGREYIVDYATGKIYTMCIMFESDIESSYIGNGIFVVVDEDEKKELMQDDEFRKSIIDGIPTYDPEKVRKRLDRLFSKAEEIKEFMNKADEMFSQGEMGTSVSEEIKADLMEAIEREHCELIDDLADALEDEGPKC